VDSEPLQRLVSGLLNELRPAIGNLLLVRVKLETELCGNDHSPAEGSERFANELFVCEWTVHLGGIEECDTAFDGGANQRDSLMLVRGGTVAVTQSHAAEAEGRDFEVGFSQFALLHLLLLRPSHAKYEPWS